MGFPQKKFFLAIIRKVYWAPNQHN